MTQNYCKTTSGKFTEADIQTLLACFPTLERSDAAAVLHESAGNVERAASVLIDVQAVDEDAKPSDHDDEDEELPAYIRCPKCYSPDVLNPEGNGALVCGKCLKHFPLSQAKKGASKGINKAPIKKKKKKRSCDSSDPESPEEHPFLTGEVGPVHQRLKDNRERARTQLRLCVSHISNPREKRVITIPKGEESLASLFKQARHKFRLKKALRGVRTIEGIALTQEALLALRDGSDVQVTFSDDTLDTPRRKARRKSSPSFERADTASSASVSASDLSELSEVSEAELVTPVTLSPLAPVQCVS